MQFLFSSILKYSNVSGAAQIAATILPALFIFITNSFTESLFKLSAPGNPPGNTTASYSSLLILFILQSDFTTISCVPLTYSSSIEHILQSTFALLSTSTTDKASISSNPSANKTNTFFILSSPLFLLIIFIWNDYLVEFIYHYCYHLIDSYYCL